ncbi:MAG: polysulfide reductase NrfD [Deltaproteobacteria bacterium]|nr:polysulfide reductase NrfD [Deltaproteobacteria bacterium]
MLNEFTVGFRTADKDLDAMVPLAMSAEGVGAAMYLIAFLAGSRAGGVAGLALVLIGAGALFAHLGHPRRSWRVITESSRTWMNRGALFTAGLVLAGAAALLFQGDGITVLMLRALALVCTFVVVAYAGILFSSINAVPFWNTSLLPILFVLHSLTSAGLLLTTMLSLAGGGMAAHPRECGIVIALLCSTLALTRMLAQPAPRSEAAQESVRLLTTGNLRQLFHGGALLAGLGWPLALVMLAYLFRGAGAFSGVLLVAAVALRLVGDVSFRSALLRAGVYAPVI